MARLLALALIVSLTVAGPALAEPDPPSFEQVRATFLAATGPERLQALAALARHRTAACVRFLDEVRRTDQDAGVRSRALRLIGAVGVDPARAILEDVLERGDRTQRASALDALALIRPEVPPAPFLAALADRQDVAVRLSAARALARYPRVDVAQALAQVLAEATPPGDDALRAPARESLRALVATAPVDAWLATDALGARSPFAAALPDLLRVAAACPHPGVRDAARSHARGPLPAARAAAADLLGELDEGRRAAAIDTLDVLAKLLRDDDPDVLVSAGLAVTRIGPAGKALDEVLTLCRSRSPGLRAIALGALGACSDEPRAVRAAAGAIDDAAPPVRAAAVAALAALATKDAVTALVAGLKKNEDGRLHAEILAALVRLTGARPGDDHAAWSRWWALVKDDFALPQAGEAARVRTGDASAPPAGSRTREPPPTYYGSEVVSRRLAFVVDVSGSMSASVPGAEPGVAALTRLQVCQRELTSVLQGLRDGTLVNLIPFDHAASPWRERALPLGRAEREAALGVVRALAPGGGTNIYDPLELALLDPSVDTVYLLSDGSPGSGKFVREDDILREVRKLNAVRRVAIHTISVGVESSLMRKLAEENAGTAVVVQ